jgi:hypothetical protein
MALTQESGRYHEITISADSRGKVAGKIATFFTIHPRIAKRFNFKVVNNQAADILIELKDTRDQSVKLIAYEFKVDNDLWDSIKSKRLQKEIVETYIPLQADACYIYAVGVFDQQQIAALLSITDEYYPHVRAKLYSTFDYAFSAILEQVVHQKFIKTIITPVDYRMRNKDLITSISSLCNGITPELVEYLLTYEGYQLRSLDALIITPTPVLKPALEEIFFMYYNEEQPALVEKFMAALHQQYQPENATPEGSTDGNQT